MICLLWLNGLSFYMKSNCWVCHHVGENKEDKREDVSIKTVHELADLAMLWETVVF